MRKRPGVFWVVLAYLVPILVVIAVGTVVLVVITDQPSTGTPCASPGLHFVRPQDGARLECIRNVQTGKLFWRVVEERGK